MIKSKQKENEVMRKMAAGGETIAYDPETHKNISLEKDGKHESSNIIKFPDKLKRTVEFQIPYESRTADDFGIILFVSKAIARNKNNAPVYKTVIHVEIEDGKKLAIATDGERLHAAAIDLDLFPRDYTIKTSADFFLKCEFYGEKTS
jgi:hypothetical protein